VGATDLYDLALEWKLVCDEAVASTIGGAIEHSYVSPGPPSTDCLPQLAVYVGTPVARADTAPVSPPLAPGMRDTEVGGVNLVNLTCVVLRCAPTFDEADQFPTVEALEAAAREVDEDLWAIWAYTRTRHDANVLFSGLAEPREMFLDPAFPVPEGRQEIGWQISLRVRLDGYWAPALAPSSNLLGRIVVQGFNPNVPGQAGLATVLPDGSDFRWIIDLPPAS
jgi:hypothetical protein